MMRHLIPVLCCLGPIASAPVTLAADPPPAGAVIRVASDLPALGLPEIADRIAERYRGRLLSVQLDGPRPHEKRLGVRQVYVADFLTLSDNRLTMRLDGDTGMFLLIDGAGQTEARIRP